MFPVQTRYKLTEDMVDILNTVYPAAYEKQLTEETTTATYTSDGQEVELGYVYANLNNEQTQIVSKNLEKVLNEKNLSETDKQDIVSDLKQLKNTYYSSDNSEMEF